MSMEPKVIALLGFGEAGSNIARGLAAEGGWRAASKPGDNAPRRVIAIDTALDKEARGMALGKEARRLDVAISDRYTEALGEADLVICAVQGEFGLSLRQVQPVSKLIAERLPATITLSGLALLVSLAVGIPLLVAFGGLVAVVALCVLLLWTLFVLLKWLFGG